MKKPSSLENKKIDHGRLTNLKFYFVNHIAQETILSKYLQDADHSKFFSDVLSILDKHSFSYELQPIFSYLVSSKDITQTKIDFILNVTPTYEQLENDLDSLKSNQEEFMNIDILQDMDENHRKDLYECLVLFIEGVKNVLADSQGLDVVRSEVSIDTNNLLGGDDFNDPIQGFDAGCLNKMRKQFGFADEMTLFFQASIVADIFEDNTAESISKIINIIHLLMIGKVNDQHLVEIEIHEITQLRTKFNTSKKEIRSLDYSELDFPNLFGFVSGDSYQRAEFIIHSVDTLLKDLAEFLHTAQRPDVPDAELKRILG